MARAVARNIPTLAEVMRRSGWTVTSLAKESRFSRVQIDRVKNGRHPGSHRLHRTLVAILGKEYAEALPFLPDW